MITARTPAHQLYDGPIYAQDYASRNLQHIISSSPDTVQTMRKRYGRYLAGFGSEDMTGSTGYDPHYQDQHVYDLEKEDDTFGSGIFDPEGRGGTDNPNMGIFAGHYSLPGFAARDVPFTVSRDITDITDDAQVVSVPGGGLFYVEDRGRLTHAAGSPPTWRPTIQPAGHTRHDQVYVDMAGRPVPMAGFGQLPVRRFHSQPRRMQYAIDRVPSDRLNPYLVPETPYERRVGYESIVHGGQVPVPIQHARHPVSASAPDLPSEPGVPLVSTVNVATQRLAIEGMGYYNALQRSGQRGGPGGVFGQEPEPPTTGCAGQEVWDASVGACMCPSGMQSTGIVGECEPATEEKKSPSALQLAFAGLLVGAGVAFVVSVTGRR